MSVIVKSMEMPPSCYFCGLTDTSFIHCEAFNPRKLLEDDCEERRPGWCPLVDLGKHGDLIDRGKVIPKLNFINEAEYQIYGCASWGFTAKCIDVFYDAPTVIEAKDSE